MTISTDQPGDRLRRSTYAELRCKTNFSFLRGASFADELVRRATELDYRALAITDVNSLSGIVRAYRAKSDLDDDDSATSDLQLIYGAELTPTDAPPVVLWAASHSAYKVLSRLITVGRRRAAKGQCLLTLQDISEHHDGLLAGVVSDTWDVGQGPHDEAMFHRYRDIFGDRAYLLASLHMAADDHHRLRELQRFSHTTRLPLVAAGDVHYHVPQRMLLFDVLSAIRTGTTIEESGPARFANAQRHLRETHQLELIYAAAPAAIARTVEIADRCDFSLHQLRYQYPKELAPNGSTTFSYLEQLTWKGAAHRYPQGIPAPVQQLVHHELSLIKELGYEPYFITVWDLVRFARSRGILCQGRGSAANSAVCFCLGVTAVDPDRTDVLFERFISRERNEAPDIDIDFEHERREEVLQYLYNKYGRERAAMTAVVIRYRLRSAVRDVGKAFGFSLDRVDSLAKQVEGHITDDKLPDHCREVGIDPDSRTGKQFIAAVNTLIDFPRHLSQHVGGMVMTETPLCELVPIENAAMEGRTVISWDKNDLEDLGILKVDCLGLGMLSAIRRCFEMITTHWSRRLTLANIPAEDAAVYDMICRADTVGLFQIESRAQMSMLPRLQPRCYYDLVIEVAIVRPGPIQGNMVHPYLRRRTGEEQVSYANDAIRAVLEKTLGVPIFQEQAMQLAVVAAGFTPGEADQLRRAMGKWRKTGVMEAFRHKLIDGMQSQGLPKEFAQQVFQQIRGFGEYGFPESHAASFALLVYVSAYLKYYYPSAYTAAIINSQPMGFYAPAQLISDAQQHGVPIHPIDVNHSDWDCTLEPIIDSNGPPAIRLGLRLIVGLSENHAATIIEARSESSFTSQADFARRTGLTPAVLRLLASADAFASLGRNRRQALWDALLKEPHPSDYPLFDALAVEDEPTVALPVVGELEHVCADYETTGMSLRNHPIAFFRQQLADRQIVPAEELPHLPDNQPVRVAGIVLLRQRPSTAKGITFVTLEDETGTINLVLFPNIWERFYSIARRSPAWIADGRLESKNSVIHVVVERLVDLSAFVDDTEHIVKQPTRNFR